MTRHASSGSPVRSVRWDGKTAVVEVAGEIDLNCSNEFQGDLLKVLDRRPDRLVIDLTNVTYMDSSGIASLVKLLSRTRKSGVTLRLAGMRDRVRSVFEITRLDTVFDIRPTVAESVEPS